MLPDTPAWNALKIHFQEIQVTPLQDLFKQQVDRFEQFSVSHNKLFLDYSKNHINPLTRRLLINLANEKNLHEGIMQMFSGERINSTENRAVLHTALRIPVEEKCADPELQEKVSDIHHVLERMQVFSNNIRSGEYKGINGDRITDVVSIGIGGSFLGPKTVCDALKPFAEPLINIHFIANVDGYDLASTLPQLDASKTLFIIQSKTFTTLETMTNATVAREWLLDSLKTKTAISQHFLAVSTNLKASTEFGILPENIFEFWDWVGGRFSLWSAIGLPIMIAIGSDRFRELLSGANSMDTHFKTASFEKNMPVILGLLGIWYNNLHDYSTQAIIPYDQRLKNFPSFLQQLDMESNGKSVGKNNAPVQSHTGPIIWGDIGSNAQHAFFQLLHQGTRKTPVDFLIGIEAEHDDEHQHRLLVANCLAQSEALMMGNVQNDMNNSHALFRSFDGNRPSNTLMFKKLTPETLGCIIALYEHKVFVQSWVWGINAFDQWGVELGKQLAGEIEQELIQDDAMNLSHDDSTNNLIRIVQKHRWDI